MSWRGLGKVSRGFEEVLKKFFVAGRGQGLGKGWEKFWGSFGEDLGRF